MDCRLLTLWLKILCHSRRTSPVKFLSVTVGLLILFVCMLQYYSPKQEALGQTIPTVQRHENPVRSSRSNGVWAGIENLESVASAIADEHGLVLFTFLNDAFATLAASWLCNTEPFGNVHSKILFLSTHADTARNLQRRWPEINVVFVNESKFSGKQFFSTARYVQLMVERTRYIQRLVQARVPLLLFEVDFVWMVDVVPTVLSYDADIVGIPVKGTQKTKTCGCFLLLRPTPRTIELWSHLTDMMDALNEKIAGLSERGSVPWQTNDQMFLSELLVQRYGRIKLAHLPEHLFRDGRWYTGLAQPPPPPIAIHNNYLPSGVSGKISRAKRFGHWFLTKNSTSSYFMCDAKALRKILNSYNTVPN